MNNDAASMVSQTLVKPLIVGAIAALGGSLVLPGETLAVPMLGQRVPTYVAAGVAGVAGSLASDVLSQYILPNIDQSNKLAYTEGRLLSPLITAGATGAAFYLMDKRALSEAGGLIALVGAGSEIAGMYAWESVIGPYLNQSQA